MPTYTIELKSVIQLIFDTNYTDFNWQITYAAFTYKANTYGKLPTVPDYTKIGLGSYPIFDNAYRPILNGKIIDEFYNREIGTESIDNFLLNIRKRMDQIMPYYNQLYLSLNIEYDPLITMKIKSVGKNVVDGKEVASGHNASTGTNASKSRAVNSTTPQTMLAGNADYATSSADSKSDSTAVASSDQNNTTDTDSTIDINNDTSGYQGIPANIMNAYRASLINIDMMVLADLEDCFMLLLNNGDAFTNQGWWYFP